MINDIDNLHDVRNLIQHGAKIPSEYDIKIYQKIVSDFFIDVCTTIYDDKITFDTVSLAKILKSPHETELLLKAEEVIGLGKYDLALNLIHTSAMYHYELIRENLSVRTTSPASLVFDHDISHRLKQNIDQLWEGLLTAIDRLSMGEYYIRFKELMKTAGRRFQYGSPYFHFFNLEFSNNTTIDNVEKARVDVYNIILGTEHLITEKIIIDSPVVYGLHVTEITSNSVVLNYGILKIDSLKKCNVILRKKNSDSPEISISISNDNGYSHQKIVTLSPNQEYVCSVIVHYTKHMDVGYSMQQQAYSTCEFKTLV